MIDLRDIPEWAQPLIYAFMLGVLALVFIVSIMLVSHLVASPQSCAKTGPVAGVKAIVQGNEHTSYDALIVCNDGTSIEK